MARRDNSSLDVLILGEHPATYFAAAMLRGKTPLKVLHATLPSVQPPDRLVLVNPAFFDLHPLLAPLRKKLDLTGLYGLQFLSDDLSIQSEYRNKSFMTFVARYRDIRSAMVQLAEDEQVPLAKPAPVQILGLDETGLDAMIGSEKVRASALIVGGDIVEAQAKMLGMPEAWEPEVMHRYSFAKLKRGCVADLGSRAIAPMSLDIKGTLGWAWMLPHGQQAQVSISIPRQGRPTPPPEELLGHWIKVLRHHKILSSAGGELPIEDLHTLDLPLAGAMAHEGVGNRTLLVGPAGGFYSACAEDIYPNCWSAVFAVEAMRKALKEVHLQDALQLYRHKWRTTLGDYLRGPQQNLRFLLPLVYRNQVMTTRLTESILHGKSVVR